MRILLQCYGRVILVALLLGVPGAARAITNTYAFSYTNRAELLADGWDFLTKSSSGLVRDSESTNGVSPPDISYDQVAHPGSLILPVGRGDLWAAGNNIVNGLFRNLSSNWTSVQMQIQMDPANEFQQVNLALYQDDDNYVEIGYGYNTFVGGRAVMFVTENGGVQLGSPRIIKSSPVALTGLFLRLERNLTNDFVAGSYSADGSNWVSMGEISQELIDPRLCIWAGGYDVTPPLDCKLIEARVATSDTLLKPLLFSGPAHLVFNSIAGQSSTNVQQLRVVDRRAKAPVGWTLSVDAAWLSVTPTNGFTPAVATVAVNPTALSPGVYVGTITCGGANAVSSSTKVTLIVNPNGRVRVSNWRGERQGAMSVSVDDSRLSGFDKLNAYGLKGTYMLWGLTPYAPFAAYYAAGMELGAHTVDHPCFAVGEPTRRYELETNVARIVAVTGVPEKEVISFAWPCGFTTIKDRVIAQDYFLSARGYNFNELEDPNPRDWMNLKNYNSHENDPHEFNTNAPSNPADLKQIVDAAEVQGKWFNLVLHTLNNDDNAIAYSAGKDVWVAAIGSVVKYMQLRSRTIFSNYVESASNLSFDFSRLPLDTVKYRNFESALAPADQLTLRIDLTNLPSVGTLTVGSVQTPYLVRDIGGRRLLLFSALPTTNRTSVSLKLADGTPIPLSQRVILPEDSQTNILLAGSSVAGHSLNFEVVGIPTNGVLTGVPPNLAYRPVSNYFGADAILFRVTDTTTQLAATGIVNVVVLARNDAPVVVSPMAAQAAAFNTAVSTYVTNVFSDPEGDLLTYTATGLPPGLQMGGGGLISGAATQTGNFSVQMIATDAGSPPLSATNTFTFSVTNAYAPITLLNLLQFYDGTARTVSAQTQPAGLSVALTYDGDPTAPTNAGNYVIVATITAQNYFGAVTNTLSVEKLTATVVLSNLNQLFNGTPREAAAQTDPPGLPVDLTYDGLPVAPVAPGSYEVVGVVMDQNHAGAATNTLLVADAPLRIESIGVTDPSTVAITWKTASNFTYLLQFNDDLVSSNWQDLPPVLTALGDTLTATNQVGTNSSQRFYRVMQLP